MDVKETARQQHARIVDTAARQLAILSPPVAGWLVTMRKALGMSGSDVAERLGVSRNAVYQAERNEQDRAITLKQMEKLAEALGGRFVYAIVPEGKVEDIIRAQAGRVARAEIRRASAHMALEAQSLTAEQARQRIEDLAKELARDMPPDFWDAR